KPSFLWPGSLSVSLFPALSVLFGFSLRGFELQRYLIAFLQILNRLGSEIDLRSPHIGLQLNFPGIMVNSGDGTAHHGLSTSTALIMSEGGRSNTTRKNSNA